MVGEEDWEERVKSRESIAILIKPYVIRIRQIEIAKSSSLSSKQSSCLTLENDNQAPYIYMNLHHRPTSFSPPIVQFPTYTPPSVIPSTEERAENTRYRSSSKSGIIRRRLLINLLYTPL